MSFFNLIETSKIFIHWDHILHPADQNAGKNSDNSWIETAKSVAGLVLFAFSTGFIGFKPSLLLFFVGGVYHFYQAYQKTRPKTESSEVEIDISKIDLPEEEVDKRNQLGINAIFKANEEGKRICLIIGRDFDQSVPEESDFLWVVENISGNPVMPGTVENRIDLKIDFNDEGKMETLKGLFDRVVVDPSTLKFLISPWHRLKALLKPLSTSQLIIESYSRVSSKHNHVTQENKKLFEQWKSQQPAPKVDREKAAFLERQSPQTKEQMNRDRSALEEAFILYILNQHFLGYEMAIKESIRDNEEGFRCGLRQLFNRVELFQNAPFPTHPRPILESYFICTGPTERSRERVKKFERPPYFLPDT